MSDTSTGGPISLPFGRNFTRVLGVIATATAVPSLLIGIPPIQNVIFNDAAKIEIDLNNDISIFDVNEPLDNLTVNFNGNDLTRTGQSLVSSRIRIINVGGKSITSSDISPADPIGFSVIGGRIIKISKYSASSIHLQKLSHPIQKNNSVFINSGLIFDPKDYIDIDILVIRGNYEKLQYRPSGKVSGQATIELVDKRTPNSKEGLFAIAFKGGILAHVARLIVYTLISVFLLFVAVISTEKFQSYQERKKVRALEVTSAGAYEHLAGHNPIAQAYAVGLFSTIGYKAFSNFYSVLKSEYEVKSDSGAFKDIAELYSANVKAKPSSIRNYLESSFSSSFNALQLARGYNLIGHDWVSQEFILVCDAMMNYLSEQPNKDQISGDSWIEHRFDLEQIDSPKRERNLPLEKEEF